VLAGLRRLYAETGQAPNCSGGSYQRLMRELGQTGLKGGRRRYPTDTSVLRYWPTFAHAWRELGITPDGRRVLTTGAAQGSTVGWAGRHEAGERNGRLTIVEFAGYQQWGKDGKERKGRWRCRCDCGREDVVRAGEFKRKQECKQCAWARGHARLKARAEAARRAAAGAQTAIWRPAAQEQA
jgi:hypothetical protein